jgi:DNA topoisomerase VI subunit B
MSKPARKSELQQKSPAEFFAENKNIAGFDNVGPRAASCPLPPARGG